MLYKVPLLLTPQPEGGFTVTSPLLPELITEGNSIEQALENAKDAFGAVLEVYQDLNKNLPPDLQVYDQTSPALVETIITGKWDIEKLQKNLPDWDVRKYPEGQAVPTESGLIQPHREQQQSLTGEVKI